MPGALSAGWREVYQWCGVDVPMTSHGEPPVGARPQSGTSTKTTMSLECPECDSALEQILQERCDSVDDIAADGVMFQNEYVEQFESMVTTIYECPSCSYDVNGVSHPVQYRHVEIDGESDLQVDPEA